MRITTYPVKKSEAMEERKNGKERVLWIIPAYNEAKSIPKVVEDILSFDKEADYVIISVGSTDETVLLCEEKGYSYLIEIDGSCNEKTFKVLASAGAEILIVGSSGLFNLDENLVAAWDKMIEIYDRETAE